MRRISKDITKHYQMACSSDELHAICFLEVHVLMQSLLSLNHDLIAAMDIHSGMRRLTVETATVEGVP